jgi:hypothetical protein
MIISLHLPKTAGTSFAYALEQHFKTRFFKDYTDFPINTPRYERNRAALQASLSYTENDFIDIDCIHGHFLPIKYLLLANKHEIIFVTWMRNPVERVLSHYFYWKRSYDPKTSPSLHRQVIEEDWSLERFCLGPELRNLYDQFLWGFPIDYFDFIGITYRLTSNQKDLISVKREKAATKLKDLYETKSNYFMPKIWTYIKWLLINGIQGAPHNP